MSERKPYIRLAAVTEGSCVDGPGMRLVLWTQGCPHRCPGCHNPQTHDFNGGEEWTIPDILRLMECNSHCTGLTLSGGDPMWQAEGILALLEAAKPFLEQKGWDVWCWTGYTWDACMRDRTKKRLLDHITTLVDGPFLRMQMPGGKWRGSRNQRVIDVQESLKTGKVCESDTGTVMLKSQ